MTPHQAFQALHVQCQTLQHLTPDATRLCWSVTMHDEPRQCADHALLCAPCLKRLQGLVSATVLLDFSLPR